MKILLLLLSALVLGVHGFSSLSPGKDALSNPYSMLNLPKDSSANRASLPWLPMITSAVLSIGLVTSPLPAQASNAAAQISLESLPPTSISIQIQDLPIVGNLLSGTYSKVPDGSIAKPSVVIKSPKDKVKAISSLATAGHIEFDVDGFLNTHLDVDVAADEAGKMNVVVQSNLIPKLPFKNAASKSIGNGRESQWSVVTNLGNGESYYFNAKTGDTQFDRPVKI